jgi:hypothetical protein
MKDKWAKWGSYSSISSRKKVILFAETTRKIPTVPKAAHAVCSWVMPD